MTSLDLESLLRAVTAESPAGANLEYDPAFAELERALLGKPEQQLGSLIVAAEGPEWRAVEQQATALLARTKDLRVAAYLTLATTHLRGFRGLHGGLSLIEALLDSYWETLHPELEPGSAGEPPDATMRVNALLTLCEPALLSALRSATLIEQRGVGALSLRSLLGNEERTEPGAVNGALLAQNSEQVALLSGLLADSLRLITQIERFFSDRGSTVNLGRLSLLLQQGSKILDPYAMPAVDSAALQRSSNGALPIPGGDGAMVNHDTGRAYVVESGAARPPGAQIQSREDVIRAIDKVCEYYAQHEPSSPVPLLLERAKRLVTMNFIDIIRELAPGAVSQFETFAGRVDEAQ